VLSDGRFAVFGGKDAASCEVLTLGLGHQLPFVRWEPLEPMHEPRIGFACAAVGGWWGLYTLHPAHP
jgi:hypothetical protein